MLFTFSALISSIYWCGIVLHQQILMVRNVTPAEIIGATNAAPVSTHMASRKWSGNHQVPKGRENFSVLFMPLGHDFSHLIMIFCK